MSTIVIGFGYKARHGKDTCVAALLERYGSEYTLKRYSFAEALKVEVYDALSNPFDPYWDFAATRLTPGYMSLPHPTYNGTGEGVLKMKLDWIEEHRAEIVKTLQYYGTEYRRAQNPFYWVNKLRFQIAKDKPQFALISDMRFRNEMAFVKAVGGYSVAVFRHLQDGSLWTDPNRDPKHESECQLDGAAFDFTVKCLDGELDELKKDAYYIFDMIVKANTPEMPDLADIAEVQAA